MTPDPTAPRTMAAIERLRKLAAGVTTAPVGDDAATLVGDLNELLAHLNARTARERELVAALRVAHLIPSQHGMPDTSVEEYAATGCQLCALLVGQPVAQDEVARLREWLPIIEEAKRQDERWLKPMPELPDKEAVYVWAMKAQEELGELSAALLGRLILKDGRGDPLTECHQLIAVLMRVATALSGEAER